MTSLKFEWLDVFTEVSGLPASRQLVGLHMWKFASADGSDVRPSTTLLCQRTGYSRHTVIDAKRDLIEKGWLTLVKQGSNTGGNKASVYRLSIPGSAVSALLSIPGSAVSAPHVVQPVHQGSATSGTLIPQVSSSSSRDDDEDDQNRTARRLTDPHGGSWEIPTGSREWEWSDGEWNLAEGTHSVNDQDYPIAVTACVRPDAREQTEQILGVPINWDALQRKLGAAMKVHGVSLDHASWVLDSPKLCDISTKNNPAAYLMKCLDDLAKEYADAE